MCFGQMTHLISLLHTKPTIYLLMKKTKILSLLAAITLSLGSLTSCFGDGESTTKYTTPLGNLFNAVVDQSTGDVTLYSNVSYQVEWDLSNNIANITVMGLQLPNSSIYPKIEIKDLNMKYDYNGWYTVSATDYIPADYAGNMIFNYLNFTVDTNFSPISINYIVDNKFKVYSLLQMFGIVGNTRITNQNTNSSFAYNGDICPSYYISYDVSTKMGYLVIQNFKLTENGSTFNVKLPLLPFSVNSSGFVTMAADSVTPAQLSATLDSSSALNSSGTALENATASNISILYEPSVGVYIKFDYTVDNGELGKEAYRIEFERDFVTSSSTL